MWVMYRSKLNVLLRVETERKRSCILVYTLVRYVNQARLIASILRLSMTYNSFNLNPTNDDSICTDFVSISLF